MPHTDTDGRTYSGHRDPPGQSSIYISPGEAWKEFYRLSTFRQFPSHATVNPAHLAFSGFYYTGYRDRVKCFSCGLCVENWVLGDDARDRKWHSNECEFINGVDTSNVPLNNTFTKFRNSNLTTSTRFPPTQTTVNGIGSHRQETPATSLPVNHTFQNRSVSHTSSRDRSYSNSINPVTSSSSTTSSSSPRSPREQNGTGERERQELFPCLAPVNPQMSSPIHRLESFKSQNGIRWPRERLRASIDQLVNAGFYYLGERDRVKCWYCNGGLQNWDYEDEPWSEHAKWFPRCEYLLRVKGPVYVEGITSQFPNLNRPAPSSVLPSPRPQNSTPANSPSRPQSSGSRGVDIAPVGVIEQGMCSDYVIQAREMGFDTEIIRAVLKRKYDANGQFYNNKDEFLEALISYTPPTSSIASNAATSVLPMSPTRQSTNALEELNKLEESQKCQICKNHPSNVVLIPCGHLVTCENCCDGLGKCPRCNRGVQDVIKTFRA